HVVGTIPPEVEEIVENNPRIVRLPFLEDDDLRVQFSAAKALLLPSEIEGFGLPAIEAYYLGTPVCFSLGTSIEEVLAAATSIGGFVLDDAKSLFAAFDDVMEISGKEIREIGLKLRVQYSSAKVAEQMMTAFRDACRHQGAVIH
ncbi:MAG: glycosyltransferase, partial [Verrucomicrobiaceae bacterium]